MSLRVMPGEVGFRSIKFFKFFVATVLRTADKCTLVPGPLDLEVGQMTREP